MDDSQIAYDVNGLVPCVVQDAGTGEVLTLAYMNEVALARTRETGEIHFFSRSRNDLWHKGETSGNTLKLKALRYDCDGDALLAQVEPQGPACQTAERTCFHRGEFEPAAPHESLPTLQRTIAERARSKPEGSYTAALLNDPARIRAKVLEEAEELVRAAASESSQRVSEEAADVLYHVPVLLWSRELDFPEAERLLYGLCRPCAHRARRRARQARVHRVRCVELARPRPGLEVAGRIDGAVVANLNHTGQTVVTGTSEAMRKASDAFADAIAAVSKTIQSAASQSGEADRDRLVENWLRIARMSKDGMVNAIEHGFEVWEREVRRAATSGASAAKGTSPMEAWADNLRKASESMMGGGAASRAAS